MRQQLSLLILTLFILAGTAQAAFDGPEEAIDVSVVREEAYLGHGLQQTICGYLAVQKVKIPNAREIRLRPACFQKALPVTAVIQPRPAPLVVVLLGITASRTSPFSQLWPSWYAEAGYNVLTFDSSFTAGFTDASGHGVSGHIWKEAEQVSQLIAEFLRRPEVNGKITDVGIVGMSYGGLQTLILSRMQADGQLPFKVSAFQAYSPPADVEYVAQKLDEWFNRYRWRYTLSELNWKIAGLNPVVPGACANGECKPIEAPALLGALAASFQLELPPVTVFNNDHYRLGLLDGDTRDRRMEFAQLWGFQKYAYDLALPYWREQSGIDPMQLLEQTRLCALLQRQSPNTEVILSRNDPFNRPDDETDVRQCAGDVKLTVLPDGGHLGYVGDEATRTRLLGLFERPAALPVSAPHVDSRQAR